MNSAFSSLGRGSGSVMGSAAAHPRWRRRSDFPIRGASGSVGSRTLASVFLDLRRANDPNALSPNWGLGPAGTEHEAAFGSTPAQGDAAVLLQAAAAIQARPPEPCLGDWSAIEALIGSVPGPEDSAREHDHYLYGSPRRAKAE